MALAQKLWYSVLREAEATAATDPALVASLASSIFQHPGLGSALACQVGQRLGKTEVERVRFAQFAREAFAAAPRLVEATSLDLASIVEHDPATTSLLPPFLNFKGYIALQA